MNWQNWANWAQTGHPSNPHCSNFYHSDYTIEFRNSITLLHQRKTVRAGTCMVINAVNFCM